MKEEAEMSDQEVGRRELLGATGALAGGLRFGLGSGLGMGIPMMMGTSVADAATHIDFGDPNVRFRSQLKTRGTLAEETVHRVSTGHVWLYNPEDHSFTPFCSLENYNVSEWSHGEDGLYRSRMFETAIYMKFGSDEVMEEWTNPFTDETVEVHHYIIGPMSSTHDPHQVDADAGAENAERVIVPNHLNWQLVGDTVYMPTDSSVAYPNPLQPDVWPQASAGETFGWDSFIMFGVKLADLQNPGVNQAMAHSWYQENIRWQPWMLMGQRPGRLIARGYGKKVRWEEIPIERIKRLEKYVPKVLDRDNWGDFQNEFLWYLRTQRPRPPLVEQSPEL